MKARVFALLLVLSLPLALAHDPVKDTYVSTTFLFNGANVEVKGGQVHYLPWLDKDQLYLQLDGHLVLSDGKRLSVDGEVVDLPGFNDLLVFARENHVLVRVDGRQVLQLEQKTPPAPAKDLRIPQPDDANLEGVVVFAAKGQLKIRGNGAKVVLGPTTITGGKIVLGTSVKTTTDGKTGDQTTTAGGPVVNRGGNIKLGQAIIHGDTKYRDKVKF